MTELTIETLLKKVPERFLPQKAAGIDAVIQVVVTGEGGGEWTATIRDQKLVVETGRATFPRITASADARDVLDIANGRLDPMQAYMSGKVHMTGDLLFAMRLAGLFDLSVH